MTQNNKNRLLLGGSLFLLALYILYVLQGILMPFGAGLLVAYIMNPAVSRLESFGLSRSLGASLVLMSFFAAIGVMIGIAIPMIQGELLRVSLHIPRYVAQLRAALLPFLENAPGGVKLDDMAFLSNLGGNYAVAVLNWVIHFLTRVLTNGLVIANILSLIVLTPLIAFYCLRDWQELMNTLEGWIPKSYEKTVLSLCREINKVLGSFMKGQAMVCLFMTLFYTLTLFFIVRLDFSLVVGPIVGLLVFIPYLGALLGGMLSMGIALSQFTDWSSIALVGSIFLAGQMVEGYLLVPYYIGDRIGLHPVWVIFSLLAGGVLCGFLGILLALPAAATLGVLFRHSIQVYKKSSYYLGTTTTL